MEKDLDDVIAEEQEKEGRDNEQSVGLFYEFILKCKTFCGFLFMLACVVCGSITVLNVAKIFSEDGSVRGMMAIVGAVVGFAVAVIVLLPIACLLKIADKE